MAGKSEPTCERRTRDGVRVDAVDGKKQTALFLENRRQSSGTARNNYVTAGWRQCAMGSHENTVVAALTPPIPPETPETNMNTTLNAVTNIPNTAWSDKKSYALKKTETDGRCRAGHQ